MAIDFSRRTIAKRQFVVGDSQGRVWDLLATLIFQQLPLEKVDIVGLNSFNAVLRWSIGFISFQFRVEGKLVDVSRPNSYGCVMLVKRKPIRLGVKVAILLKMVDASKTEVFCIATEDGKRTIMGWVLGRQQRNFALNMFDSIGARLQQLCS